VPRHASRLPLAHNLPHSGVTPPSYAGPPGSCAVKANLSAAQLSRCQQINYAFLAGVSVGATSQSHVALHQLLDYSLISLWALAGLCALLGWVAARRALRPVHAIAAAAQQASDENLSVRIALAGPRDEIKYLADTFDAMLERLDAAFASQRRFVANASHELHTPLAVIRAAIDVTMAKSSPTTTQLTEMAAEVAEAAERAETLIEALPTLARSDRGIERREELDLAVVAEDVIGAAESACQLLGLTVDTRLEPGLIFGGPGSSRAHDQQPGR
jgi:signal transduction histidine kinase